MLTDPDPEAQQEQTLCCNELLAFDHLFEKGRARGYRRADARRVQPAASRAASPAISASAARGLNGRRRTAKRGEHWATLIRNVM